MKYFFYSVFLLFTVLTLLSNCWGSQHEGNASEGTLLEHAKAPRREKILLTEAQSSTLMAEINLKNIDSIDISFENRHFWGISMEKNVRSYQDETGFLFFKCKNTRPALLQFEANDGGFIMEVLIKEDEIVISKEKRKPRNAIVLSKNKQTGTITIAYQGKKLGESEFLEQKKQVVISRKGQGFLTVNTPENSYGFAVLALDALASEEKYALMAELMVRGL